MGGPYPSLKREKKVPKGKSVSWTELVGGPFSGWAAIIKRGWGGHFLVKGRGGGTKKEKSGTNGERLKGKKGGRRNRRGMNP